MLDLVLENKEWIFSGIGVFLLGFLIKIFANKSKQSSNIINAGSIYGGVQQIVGEEIIVNNRAKTSLLELSKLLQERYNRIISEIE